MVRSNSISGKTMVFLCLIIIVCFCSTNIVQAQEYFEPEAIPHTTSRPSNINPWTTLTGWSTDGNNGGGGKRKSYDRVNNWMRVLQEFFTEGNWLQGGPNNILEYLTRTLTKLLDLLLNRNGGSGTILPPEGTPIQPDAVDDPTRISSDSRSGSTNYARQRINLNDLIRMIPMNELNFNHNP